MPVGSIEIMTGTKVAKPSVSASRCFPARLTKPINKKRRLAKLTKRRLKKKMTDNKRHSGRFEGVYAVTGKNEFHKLFDETVNKLGKGHLEFPKDVVRTLQEASDSFLEDLFESSQWWASYGKRKTLTGKDLLSACGQKAAPALRKAGAKKRRK